MTVDTPASDDELANNKSPTQGNLLFCWTHESPRFEIQGSLDPWRGRQALTNQTMIGYIDDGRDPYRWREPHLCDEGGELMGIASVTAAIAAVGAGEIVIVTDDESRENEGDLIMASEAATPEKIAFFLRHTSGVLCAAITKERADNLNLPMMVEQNEESQQTAFTVTVDLAHGITTGISASDRASTLVALADPTAGPTRFVRPGHILPLRARNGGVLKRAGHTEAAVDLARLAGLQAAGTISEVVTGDKLGMAQGPELARLAAQHGLVRTSIASLIRYRLSSESLIRQIASARVPTRHGEFVCYVWESMLDGIEHVALVKGDVCGSEPVL
ncbi:3,4-dihydroxy-2-butanone-4-phosphate synthase, partial [Streptomyces sp. NPDC058171]